MKALLLGALVLSASFGVHADEIQVAMGPTSPINAQFEVTNTFLGTTSTVSTPVPFTYLSLYFNYNTDNVHSATLTHTNSDGSTSAEVVSDVVPDFLFWQTKAYKFDASDHPVNENIVDSTGSYWSDQLKQTGFDFVSRQGYSDTDGTTHPPSLVLMSGASAMVSTDAARSSDGQPASYIPLTSPIAFDGAYYTAGLGLNGGAGIRLTGTDLDNDPVQLTVDVAANRTDYRLDLYDLSPDPPNAAPEPSTYAMAGSGLLAVWFGLRRRRNRLQN